MSAEKFNFVEGYLSLLPAERRQRKPVQNRISAILQIPTPKTKRQVQESLGAAGILLILDTRFCEVTTGPPVFHKGYSLNYWETLLTCEAATVTPHLSPRWYCLGQTSSQRSTETHLESILCNDSLHSSGWEGSSHYTVDPPHPGQENRSHKHRLWTVGTWKLGFQWSPGPSTPWPSTFS